MTAVLDPSRLESECLTRLDHTRLDVVGAERLGRVGDRGAEVLRLLHPETDVGGVDLFEEGGDDPPGSLGPVDVERSRSPQVPCRHEQVAEAADVIEVVVGEEHRIEIVERDVDAGELRRHAPSGVEQQAEAGGLDERRGALPGRVGARAAGSEKRDAHGR